MKWNRRNGREDIREVKPGVLIISHGSRVREWVSLVDETVRMIAVRADVPVVASFLELVEGRLIQDGIDQLEAAGVTDMFVIPLFVSSGSTHVEEIGWALGAYDKTAVDTDLQPFRVRCSLTYGQPIDADPEIVEVVLERLSGLSTEPAKECLLLIGHGSEHDGFYEGWQRGLSALAEAVRTKGGYAGAGIAMLRPDTAAAAVRALKERNPGCEVLAMPVFLGEGYFTREVVPQRLNGLGCRYNGRTLMPHPNIAQWISRQIAGWLNTRK